MALVVAALGVVPGVGNAARQQQLLRANLSQAGRELIFTVRTRAPVPLGRLEPRPDTRSAGSHYLCLALSRKGGKGERQLCLGGPKAHRRVGLEAVNGVGKPIEAGGTAGAVGARATVRRPSPRKLVVALVPADAGLSPQRYSWRVLASRGCKIRRRCAESLPSKGSFNFRLRPVREVGCTGGSTGLVTNGPRERKVVALTFDDGPSDYTPGFLDVLRDEGVPGTFFEIGQEMPGREATMRRVLAEGSELGDHTENHVELPDYAQIAAAAERIGAYTHFQPCLFRPPGGAVDAGVLASAGSLGMRTVTWDVDPADWADPGSGAVYSRIVGAAQPGSIILMHDGGGDRSGTLATLPSIIDTLRARGYRFATVSALLGDKLIYKPYD
ncbi:MAG TPA: polysaccharide deacetylase family protein [Solirubrobacterales bacterium]|nr:polysaccharide deacetylase family protein [Solirubrobacterales bacterium]